MYIEWVILLSHLESVKAWEKSYKKNIVISHRQNATIQQRDAMLSLCVAGLWRQRFF